ncbi:hypothetical protein LPJ67_004175 [Coemansia sp. RSA 1938]|nr:hypothetical protein LPJ67_004175 [Coemansia sp. RSA 1938]
MKFTSVLIASAFGMFVGAQPVLVGRSFNQVNVDYVVETVYATVTAHSQVQVPKDDVVVVTVTETVQGGHVAPPAGHTVQSSSVATQAPVFSTLPATSTTPVVTVTRPAATSTPAPTATPTPTATTTKAPASTTQVQATSTPSTSNWQSEMLQQLNAIRAAAGKSSVSLDTRVNAIAQSHSQYQNKVRSMTHSDPAGSLGTRYSASGINWQGAAENIAWNQKTVSDVMTAWKNSAGHYANMVGDYNFVGFGVDNLYWTQDFLKA